MSFTFLIKENLDWCVCLAFVQVVTVLLSDVVSHSSPRSAERRQTPGQEFRKNQSTTPPEGEERNDEIVQRREESGENTTPPEGEKHNEEIVQGERGQRREDITLVEREECVEETVEEEVDSIKGIPSAGREECNKDAMQIVEDKRTKQLTQAKQEELVKETVERRGEREENPLVEDDESGEEMVSKDEDECWSILIPVDGEEIVEETSPTQGKECAEKNRRTIAGDCVDEITSTEVEECMEEADHKERDGQVRRLISPSRLVDTTWALSTVCALQPLYAIYRSLCKQAIFVLCDVKLWCQHDVLCVARSDHICLLCVARSVQVCPAERWHCSSLSHAGWSPLWKSLRIITEVCAFNFLFQVEEMVWLLANHTLWTKFVSLIPFTDAHFAGRWRQLSCSERGWTGRTNSKVLWL